MKTAKYGFCLMLVTGLIAITGCNKGKDVAGNTSETGNALVSGYLYNFANGSPAVGAKVRFVRAGYDPYHQTLSKAFVVTDSTVADSNGVYRTNNLDTGTYNVFGAGADGNMSLVDSFKVTGDTQVVNPDTLKGPATLAGHIKLQPGDEPDKIIAIAMGSNTFSLISTAAQFSFANLAEGHYAVKFFSTLDNYSNYDTTFTIVAGTNVSLPDSIVIPLKIPIPTGFTLRYDTLKQFVMLSWNKMNPAKVKGYNVYRKSVASAEVNVNAQPLLDTFYVDSTGIQDQTYEYRVASVDKSAAGGTKSTADSVKLVSGYRLVREIGRQGTGDGQFSSLQGIAFDSMGNVYVADRMPIGSIPRIQKFDSLGIYLGAFGSDTGLLNGIAEIAVYKDSLIYVVDPGNSKIAAFNLNGDFAFQFPVGGLPPYYHHPFSIAVFDTALFVTDIMANKVCKYAVQGDSLNEWSFPENVPLSPGLITASIDGIVYFKQISNVIYVLNGNGTMTQEFRLPQDEITSYGISAGNTDGVFVPDVNLNLVWEIGGDGSIIGRFAVQQPGKIAVDSRGRIYVGSQDTRIQVFQR